MRGNTQMSSLAKNSAVSSYTGEHTTWAGENPVFSEQDLLEKNHSRLLNCSWLFLI